MYLLFIYYRYSFSNQNKNFNLKNVYIVYFIFCFLKISRYKMYFLASFYFIFKNSIIVTLQYDKKIAYSMSILLLSMNNLLI